MSFRSGQGRGSLTVTDIVAGTRDHGLQAQVQIVLKLAIDGRLDGLTSQEGNTKLLVKIIRVVIFLLTRRKWRVGALLTIRSYQSSTRQIPSNNTKPNSKQFNCFASK